MRKRNLQKAVVLLLCVAFLGLSASGLSAATTTTQKPTKVSFSLLFRYPVQLLLNLFPGLRNIIKIDPPAPVQSGTTSSTRTIKPTGTIKSIRLSGGD
jgi:hypothetical protein